MKNENEIKSLNDLLVDLSVTLVEDNIDESDPSGSSDSINVYFESESSDILSGMISLPRSELKRYMFLNNK